MLQQIEPTEEQLKFIEAIGEEESAAQFGRKLSTAQKLWCLEFVNNNGDAVKAAATVGYSAPLTSGHKNMVHKGCLELIRRLSVERINLLLPSLFARLYAIATDEKTSARAAVDAINTLIDRVVAPHPKGPSTAIQINNGAAGDGVGKGQAQIIIQELWTAREEREARRQAAHRAAGDIVDRQTARNVSDIDGRMSDKTDAALQLLEHIVEGDGVGGGEISKVVRSASSIPAPLSAPHEDLPQEKNDDRYDEENDAAPACGDSALGPGRGEGAAAEGGGDAAWDDHTADAGAGSSERTVVGRSVAEVGKGGSVGEVVWGPVEGGAGGRGLPEAVGNEGTVQFGTDAGPSRQADAGGAIDIFADD